MSNSEEPNGRGGAGALRFAAAGDLIGGYRILDGTSRNCAGGATPWGTWLSCEEVRGGYVFETWPPGVKRFSGGEGCHYADGKRWFTAKGSDRVWRYDAVTDRVTVVYDAGLIGTGAPLRGVDDIVRAGSGDLLVAEDGDNMELCLISPDGTRLYFSSQRGARGAGVTFEISGPFRGAAQAGPVAVPTAADVLQQPAPQVPVDSPPAG